MSKNTNISELINYISYDGSGNVVFTTVSAAVSNTDKFLVSDAGVLKFRTAAQLLSDIGAQASGSYQAALSGTGFVKISGTTISYDNSTYATQTYVTTAISNLVASSPATLDTLNELALALGNDANFATTVATSIGTKQAQLNGTGFVKVTGTTVSYDNSTYLTTSTAGTTYVPYTGATGAVNLGAFDLTVNTLTIGKGGGNLSNNTALGYNVLVGNTTGNYNVGVGTNALSSLGIGSNNTVIGYTAGMSIYSGSNNTIVGIYAGASTLSSNVIIADGAGNIRFQWDGSNIKLNGNTVGSNAYTSTAYLPLVGGTLTGALSGTSATFTSTITSNNAIGVEKNGSGTFGSGGRFYLYNAATTDGMLMQLNASNNIDYWGVTSNAATASPVITFTRVGAGIFSNNLTVNGIYNVPNTSYFVGGTQGFRFNNSTDAYNNFIIKDNGDTYTRGSVSIGTSSAVEPLTVSYAAHGLISQHRQSNGIGVGQNFYMKFNNASGNAVNYAGIYADIQANTDSAHSGRMILQVANAGSLLSAIIIANNGNVGIGGAPQGLLDVFKSTSGGLGGHIMLRNNGAAVGNEMAVMFVDGDATTMRAAISSTTEGSPYYGDIKFKTGLGTYASLTTRMTVSGEGKVGIGFTPSYKLQVAGEITTHAGTNTSYYAYMNYLGTTYNFGSGETTDNVDFKIAGGATWSTGGNFRWWTQTGSATPILRMRVTPTGSLHINRATYFGDGYGLVIGSDDMNLQCTAMMVKNNGNNCLNFFNAATTYVASISINASTVTYGTGSDYRLKEDLKDFNGLDKVSEIKVYDFKYKVEGDRMEGVLAHELQEVIPYAVTGYKDELDNQGNAKIQNVDYSKLVPVLVKAIQELKAENDLLKNRLDKNNIN